MRDPLADCVHREYAWNIEIFILMMNDVSVEVFHFYSRAFFSLLSSTVYLFISVKHSCSKSWERSENAITFLKVAKVWCMAESVLIPMNGNGARNGQVDKMKHSTKKFIGFCSLWCSFGLARHKALTCERFNGNGETWYNFSENGNATGTWSSELWINFSINPATNFRLSCGKTAGVMKLSSLHSKLMRIILCNFPAYSFCDLFRQY